MIPVQQTILHDPENGLHGNCLSAVLASLLHLPIAEVPNFITPNTWVQDLNQWLRPYGLAYCMVEDFDCHVESYGIKGLWHEVSGTSPRNPEITHACVAQDLRMVHDPHPDNTGLARITCSGFFIALRPWEVAQLYRPTNIDNQVRPFEQSAGLEEATPRKTFDSDARNPVTKLTVESR